MIAHTSHKIKTNRKSNKKGFGLVNTLINKLPVELHIPGYNFCGPGTHLEKRLNRGDVGVNPLDSACQEHDIAYAQSEDLSRRHEADKILGNKAWQRVKANDSSLGEKSASLLVAGIMKGKRKLGMGIKATKGGKLKIKKKRIIRPPKKLGGFLPLILPILAAIGALAGGSAGIAKAVNDSRASKDQLTELQRHNKAMEGKGLFINPFKQGKGLRKGKGLFIKPYKGGSIKRRAIKKKAQIKFPQRALTNIDLIKYVKILGIPNFKGVYMRTHLPKKIKLVECGIVNLDSKENDGTHWTAYIKKGNKVVYFDSYGNLKPPLELVSYFNSSGKVKIYYTYEAKQTFNSYNCGQLSLEFLYNNMT